MISVRRLLMLGAIAITASASPITWTLSGVTSLGTTITGSFVYDADTNTYSSIDIVTLGGSVIPSETWTVEADTGDGPTFLGLVDTPNPNQTGADLLGLFFTGNPLTDAGGTVRISETQQGVCNNATCSGFTIYGNDPGYGWNTNVTGDAIGTTATVEPPSLILSGAGTFFLLILRRRMQWLRWIHAPER